MTHQDPSQRARLRDDPAGDDASTTGPAGRRQEVTGGGSLVGRVAGQDVGYAGETGAERRADAADEASATEAADDPPA